VIRTELGLRLPNNAGALAGVCRLLADENVNVLAMSLGDSGQLRLLVDNHVRAAGALRDARHTVAVHEVLVVEGSGVPGTLRLIADAGINVNYSYGSASTLVLGVDDAMRASAATGV